MKTNTFPLAIYESKDQQINRRSYSYGNIVPVITPTNKIPPFQLNFGSSESTPQIDVYDKDDNWIKNISDYIDSVVSKSNSRVLYVADNDVIPALDYGVYYLKISFANRTYYSEMFIATDVSKCTMIEWKNIFDMVFDGGSIIAISDFTNRLYFTTEIAKPDYTFTEEGSERDGLFFAEKQLSEKVYKFNVLTNEPVCDCMRFIRMADYVRITDNLGRVFHVEQFLITPTWQEQADVVSVDCEFHSETIAKKLTMNAYDYDGMIGDEKVTKTITENGTTIILPNVGRYMSSVKVVTNVSGAGVTPNIHAVYSNWGETKEIEIDIYNNSGYIVPFDEIRDENNEEMVLKSLSIDGGTKLVSLKNLLQNCDSIDGFTFKINGVIDGSELKNISYAFSNYTLANVDLSNIRNCTLTNCEYAFGSAIESINFGTIKFSNTTNLFNKYSNSNLWSVNCKLADASTQQQILSYLNSTFQTTWNNSNGFFTR